MFRQLHESEKKLRAVHFHVKTIAELKRNFLIWQTTTTRKNNQAPDAGYFGEGHAADVQKRKQHWTAELPTASSRSSIRASRHSGLRLVVCANMMAGEIEQPLVV